MLTWRTTPSADLATVVLGGLVSLKLRAEDRRWAIEGSDGRTIRGDAASRGHARVMCLAELARHVEDWPTEARMLQASS